MLGKVPEPEQGRMELFPEIGVEASKRRAGMRGRKERVCTWRVCAIRAGWNIGVGILFWI